MQPQALRTDGGKGKAKTMRSFAEFIISEKARFFISFRMTQRRVQNDTEKGSERYTMSPELHQEGHIAICPS